MSHPLVNRLRALTPARVRFEGGTGAAPLDAVLDFQASHARAREAIHTAVDWEALSLALAPLPTRRLRSQAVERSIYLRRPDLGRRLDPSDAESLTPDPCDLVIVIGDGLSATAVTQQAAAVCRALAECLPDFRKAPIMLVAGARVAIGDQIAALIGARLCLMLIGERPGLSVSDSLGAYLTLNATPGVPDSARNCVSNIHGQGGLTPLRAAQRLTWLIHEALRLGQTGIALKDESDANPLLDVSR